MFIPASNDGCGNPIKSYRTQSPLKIVGEVVGWNGRQLGITGASCAAKAFLHKR